MDHEKLLLSLKAHEGCRLDAYQDTVGVWTIGYGRNLQTLRIGPAQAETWLREDMLAAVLEAQKFPEYNHLDTDARRNAFTEMVFNMGAPRVRNFKNMLAAVRQSDWNRVAIEAIDSQWARQVGRRANVLAAMFVTGQFS